MKYAFTLVALFSCSDHHNATPDATIEHDAMHDAATDAPSQPFACPDFAYCSTDTVGAYVATQDTPMGGTISDGIYRFAWEIDTSANQPNAADALEIRGNQFVSGTTMGRGTVEITGTHLTLAEVAECDAGMETGASPESNDFEFTALPDRLVLFISEGPFITEEVWLKVTDACATVATPPLDPGDSFACRNPPCHCAALTNGAITDQCSGT